VQELVQKIWFGLSLICSRRFDSVDRLADCGGRRAVVRGILNRTNIDNRIAAGITGRSDSRDLPR